LTLRAATPKACLPAETQEKPMRTPRLLLLATTAAALALTACTGAGEGLEAGNANATAAAAQTPGEPPRARPDDIQTATGPASRDLPFAIQEIARFSEPWAMTFLPGSNRALITERGGTLKLWEAGGAVIDVAGVPRVDHGGQGGLGDVALHPDFASNGLVYLSFAEAGEGNVRGAAVGRGRLVEAGNGARLENFQVIWRQLPKTEGRGHYGHRLAFSPDGRYLFISNGDRQLFDPAQDNSQHLGTIVRLTADGGTPPDNPLAGQGAVQAQLWSWGHRNPLGLAFDGEGRLWSHEMGPRHGDEFNQIVRGRNYGYPVVSEGDHYDGARIPRHATRPEFEAPHIAWTPAVSPAGLAWYDGALFPAWRGSFFMGGLSGQSLLRIAIENGRARVADTWAMGRRIREVEPGPDGSLYVLVDTRGGSGGELLRLTPR
jgi:aldose sugar dehydrogenase